MKKDKAKKLEEMHSINVMLKEKSKEMNEMTKRFYELSKVFKFERDIKRCEKIARRFADTASSLNSLSYRLTAFHDKNLLK